MPSFGWEGLLTPAPTSFGPDLKQVYALQNLAQQMQARQFVLDQERQGQNALAQVFSNPENVGPQGLLKPNALAQLGRASPSALLDYLPKASAVQHNEMLAQAQDAKLRQGWMTQRAADGREALATYETVLKNTGDQAQAQKAAQDVWSERLNDARGSGLYSPQWIDSVPKQMPPADQLRMKLDAYDASRAKPMSEGEKVRAGLEAERVDIEGQKLTETQRSNIAKEAEAKKAPGTQAFNKFMQEHPHATAEEQQQFIQEGKVPKAALLDDDTAKMMAQQYLAGDRTVMQNLGRGAQGAENVVKVRGEIRKQMEAQGKSGADIATKIAEFEGLKAGERALGTRTAQMGMALNEAKTFAPLALAASEKVDRTQFPTLNSLLLAAERGTGGEDVIRLAVATNSLLNAYARAVTPTGTPTEGAQERARALLDAAWSKGQYRTAIDQLMKEMDAASKSPGMVREEFRERAAPGTSVASPASAAQPTTTPAARAAIKAGSLDVTEEQYNKLPPGAAYTVPGDSTVRYKQ